MTMSDLNVLKLCIIDLLPFQYQTAKFVFLKLIEKIVCSIGTNMFELGKNALKSQVGN